MTILITLKEGGGLNIDTIGRPSAPIDEDLDFIESASGSLSFAFRVIMNAISNTNSTSSQARAIVLGV